MIDQLEKLHIKTISNIEHIRRIFFETITQKKFKKADFARHLGVHRAYINELASKPDMISIKKLLSLSYELCRYMRTLNKTENIKQTQNEEYKAPYCVDI